MDPLLTLLAIMVPILLLGAGLIAISKWARGRNAELKQSGGPTSATEAERALFQERDVPKYARLLLFGESPVIERTLGRFLAIGVILFVAAFLVWLGVMLVFRG